ncbi:MAG: histone deacetylase family protein [Peptococcaceae bacterium]|nr:histone deacetylase family protein [Peptococcaceae bacterium]
MKVVFHERYREVYASDWASEQGRLDGAYRELCGCFDFVEPDPAKEEDLKLVHSTGHIEKMKENNKAYEVAVLAAGGAIKAAQLAVNGERAFALVRPPGHHATVDCKWGFCIFNNIAIAVEKLRREGSIKKALIIDIDLHFGDGTSKIFKDVPDVIYHHVKSRKRSVFLKRLENFLAADHPCDLVAVSAGFDTHEYDWGFLLKTADYNTIGKMIKSYADRCCGGKLFGVLEGGYNHYYLGRNIKAFIMGLEGCNYQSPPQDSPPVFML